MLSSPKILYDPRSWISRVCSFYQNLFKFKSFNTPPQFMFANTKLSKSFLQLRYGFMLFFKCEFD